LVGTDFNDDFRAGCGVTQKLVFDGGAGSDILIGGKGEDLLIGGAGADHLNGDDAIKADGTQGYDGTTYITSWGAVDIDLERTSHSIQFGGDAQGDRLYNMEAVEGSINSDSLLGDSKANLLWGNDGNDTIEGRGGKDEVNGGAGDDLIYGDADGDILDGSAGIDTLSYQHVGGPVAVDLGAPGAAPDSIKMAIVPNAGGRGLSSFENLIGTNSGDILIGDIGYNRIEGRDGNDGINGGDGDDILVGGAGGDTLIGGRGSDWVYYDDSSTGVTADLVSGGSGGTAQNDVYGTVENILGSLSADALLGNDVDNIIDPNISGAAVTEFVDGRGSFGDTLRLNYSGVGVDIGQGVVGGFDYNTFAGGSFQRLNAAGTATLDTVNFANIERLDVVGTHGADTVFAGYLGDHIVTGAGNDTIFAGNGDDVVYAGSGDDFVAHNHLPVDAAPTVAVFALNG